MNCISFVKNDKNPGGQLQMINRLKLTYDMGFEAVELSSNKIFFGNNPCPVYMEILDGKKKVMSPGGGAWNPGRTVLIVAERYSGPLHWGVPLVNFVNTGCSIWLAQKLYEAGIDEEKLHWVNAVNERGAYESPDVIKRLRPSKIIALGTIAARWSSAHAPKTRISVVSHPQHHKRFHFNDRYPLIEVLKNAT